MMEIVECEMKRMDFEGRKSALISASRSRGNMGMMGGGRHGFRFG
jgi:hypothetical protein